MPPKTNSTYEAWPALPYEAFKPTQHLLHMFLQAVGKYKLLTPFEPHWANVALWPTSRGITTGPIPFNKGCFGIDIDLIDHHVTCSTTWGGIKKFDLKTNSVANLTADLFTALNAIEVDAKVNLKPQEIEHPILFNEDTQIYEYDQALANAWWRILISSYRVLERYHAYFTGRSPAVGLMWGTLDLRDARYLNKHVATQGINAGYIRRNAMDVVQVESGWWSGNPAYPRAAYFSFMYPQPKEIELAKIRPSAARWDKTLGEFILDYDDLRKASDPEKDLLAFFQSTYRAESEKAGWSAQLVSTGEPV